MLTPIIKDPPEVDARLHVLGLERSDLMEPVWAMVSARSSCTEYDAPSAPGSRAYFDGTRRLREVLCPKGWTLNNDYNIPSIVHPASLIRITVNNTDDGTGQEDSHPQHWTKRGPANRFLVYKNYEQMSLVFPDLIDKQGNVVPFAPKPAFGPNPTTWYLCVFSEGDTVRAELSCPVACEHGFCTDFAERIILISDDGFNLDPEKQNLPADEPDVEINVSFKS